MLSASLAIADRCISPSSVGSGLLDEQAIETTQIANKHTNLKQKICQNVSMETKGRYCIAVVYTANLMCKIEP